MVQLHKQLGQIKFLRYVRSVCFFSIFLMLSLAFIHPVVMAEKETVDFIVDVETDEEFVDEADEVRNHLDASESNTGMESWSDDFISINGEVPTGVYYGTMLHEYLTEDIVQHDFVKRYEEYYAMNMVWFQNKFQFSRDMIMSGASEFWVKLPMTADSVRSFYEEIDEGLETTCSVTLIMGSEHYLCDTETTLDPVLEDYALVTPLPLVHLFMWEDGNKDDTFFHRPIVVDPRIDSSSTVYNGLAIVDNRIYVRCKYPVLPDKDYVFELMFYPSEGKPQLFVTDELTIRDSITTIYYSELFLGLDAQPAHWPSDGSYGFAADGNYEEEERYAASRNKDFIRDYLLNNFAPVAGRQEAVLGQGAQPVWNFMFTQGMDEGMFGMKQRFNPGDTLVISPRVPEQTSNSARRMHMFVPWVNHDGEEFTVDLRVEAALVDETKYEFFSDTSTPPVPVYDSYSIDYWDTREDCDQVGGVDGDLDLAATTTYWTPWRTEMALYGKYVNDKTVESEEYTVWKQSQSPNGVDKSNLNEVEFAIGKSAVMYYHGLEVNGIYMRGIDTADIYEEAESQKKLSRERGEKPQDRANPDDNWMMGIQSIENDPGEVDLLNPDERFDKQAITYRQTTKTIQDTGYHTWPKAHFTLWKELSDGTKEQIFDGDGRSQFIEDATLTGSANTFAFAFNDPTITRIFIKDVKGPLATRSKTTYAEEKPENSDGIPVKDFLLFTIPTYIYRDGDIPFDPADSPWYWDYKLYITFRETVELTFLAHMVDHDRVSWPWKWQNTVRSPLQSEPDGVGGYRLRAENLGFGYWGKAYLTPYDGYQSGYYGVIATGMESSDFGVDQYTVLGSMEPLGYEVYGALDYANSAHERWDQIMDQTEAIAESAGNREYRRFAGFQPVAFTGVYKSSVYIEEEDVIREITLLPSGSKHDNKDSVIDMMKNGWENFVRDPDGFIIEAANAVLVKIWQVVKQVWEGIKWIGKQISDFFGKIFSIITSILDSATTIVALGLILFVLAAFAYITSMMNRFMDSFRMLIKKLSRGTERRIQRL